MSRISITVVIVSYQSASLSVDALHSIQLERKRFPNLEIKAVVVDNASGDTPYIKIAIEENKWTSWVSMLTAPKNGGFGYGNNLGFSYALENWPVDYFHVLNPDTQVRNGAIDELVKFIEGHPKVGIAGSSFETSEGKVWPYAFRFPSYLSELESSFRLGIVTKMLRNKTVSVEMGLTHEKVDWLSGASMMLRSKLVKQLRGFDESYFLYFEETDLCLRAWKAGYEVWYVPQSRVMHILGQSTKVNEIREESKRLPIYWFESRANYFLKNHGLFKTLLIDASVLVAWNITIIKFYIKILFGKPDTLIKNYARDILRSSPWGLRNIKAKPFITQIDTE